MPRSRRSATRSVGPQSPPKPRQPTASPSSTQTRRSARGASRGKAIATAGKSKPASRLSAVTEENVTPVGLLRKEGPRSSTTENLYSSSPNDSNSSDDDSDELDDLDRDMVIENLPALYQDAFKILSLASRGHLPASPIEVVSQSTSAGRQFRLAHLRFQTTLQAYRRDEGFIPIERVLRRVMQSPRAMPWSFQPDTILRFANCAILLSDFMLYNHESKLELLANNFPGDPNESSSHLSATPVDLGTIQLAVSLRTQYFISKATEQNESQDLDVNSLLAQVFYDEDGHLLGFENHDAETLKTVTEACRSRTVKITSILAANSSSATGLRKLSEAFPWKTFFADLVTWLMVQKQAFQKEIDIMGGPEAIVQELFRQEAQDTERISPPDAKPVSKLNALAASAPVHAAERISSAKMSKRMQQLKQLRAKHAIESEDHDSDASSTQERESSQEIPQSPELDEPAREMRNEMQFLIENADEARDPSPPAPTQGSIAPSQKTAMILSVARRQAVQSNKENIDTNDNTRRFTDKQVNAKRVDWDDNLGGHNGKRSRKFAGDEDDEDDDSFEIDTRDFKRFRVEKKPAIKSESWVPNDFEEEEQQAQADDQLRSEEQRHHQIMLAPSSTQPGPSRSPLQARSSSNLRPPPSSAPAVVRSRSSDHRSAPPPTLSRTPEAAPIPATATEIVNREAKENVRRLQAAATSDLLRPQPQIRRPWTVEETNRLMDMVALHGTAWALILQEDQKHPDGPELQGRGQVALKDKARNIKMDYLKACQQLPEGFNIVSIKASDMAKLDELGIPHLGGHGGRSA